MTPPKKDNFYRDKTWELLFDDIRSIKENQEAQAKDIGDIKAQIRWIVGIATGVTFVINVLWVFIKAKVSKLFS